MTQKNAIFRCSEYTQKTHMENLPYRRQLRDFLALSLDNCMKAVNADRGSIFLFDPEKQELVLEVVKNTADISGGLSGIRARLGERVVGKVALERKPFLVADIDNFPAFFDFPRYDDYQSKSFLSVPLEHNGALIGVVNVTEKTAGGVFDDEDLKVVMDICNHLGIAVYNLKRYLDRQREERRALMQKIAVLEKSLDHSQKFSSLGKLVGGLVHEINNPLDGIIRYVNLACDCVSEEEIVREYLTEARQGLKRIATIIRSLLDFSWSMSQAKGQIDVNRAIEESLFMMKHYLASHNIRAIRDLAPAVPRLPDYRLKLIFNNIIKNACEAMADGGELTVRTAYHQEMIKISFRDTGPGIPENIQEKIFEPFFTTKNMGEGSGLGMAISYEIVQRYQGTISIESEEGKGTTFTVRLPVYKSTESE